MMCSQKPLEAVAKSCIWDIDQQPVNESQLQHNLQPDKKRIQFMHVHNLGHAIAYVYDHNIQVHVSSDVAIYTTVQSQN